MSFASNLFLTDIARFSRPEPFEGRGRSNYKRTNDKSSIPSATALDRQGS